MKKKYVVGVDLGGTKIYTALVDLEGNIIKEKTVETLAFEGENAVMGRIIDTINYVIDGTEKNLIKSIKTEHKEATYLDDIERYLNETLNLIGQRKTSSEKGIYKEILI